MLLVYNTYKIALIVYEKQLPPFTRTELVIDINDGHSLWIFFVSYSFPPPLALAVSPHHTLILG